MASKTDKTNAHSKNSLSEEDSMYLRCYRDLLLRHSDSQPERDLVAVVFDHLQTEGVGTLEQEILTNIKNKSTPLHCILLTMVYFASKRYGSGYELVSKALSLDPDFVPAVNILGEVRVLEKDFDDAIAIFERSIVLDPEQFQARHILADIYRQKGQHEYAIRVLDPLRENTPESPDLWIWLRESHNALGTLVLFQNHLLDATEAHQDCCMVWFHLGFHFLSISSLQEALDAFSKANVLSPNDDAAILSNMGHTLQRMGNLEAAVQFFRRATRLQPTHASAWMNLVSVLYQMDQQDDEYHKALQRVVELEPNILDRATFYRLDDGVGVPSGYRGESV